MAELPNLSDDEKEAKQLLFQVYNAYDTEIGYGDVKPSSNNLPKWFDAQKFKRGQEFFKQNRFAVQVSNIMGLAILLAEPNGLDILVGTGKSSTAETACKRYVETAFHLNTWYECDLTENSDLWKSLNRVRYLHLAASKASIKKNIGFISQTEVIMTVFGFMGFPLIKPHLFGLRCASQEDREGFIHFWALMAWILGIDDDLNFCLRSLKVCETFCHIKLRYLFAPLIQLEFSEFEMMMRAVVDGLSQFFRAMTYDDVMFFVRRACSVPGYQYAVDLSCETLVHDIFTEDEIKVLNSKITRHKMPLHVRCYFTKEFQVINSAKNTSTFNNNSNCDTVCPKNTVIKAKDYEKSLNDSQFYQLDVRSQLCVRLRCFQLFINNYSFGRWLNNILVDFVKGKMQRWYSKKYQRSPIT